MEIKSTDPKVIIQIHSGRGVSYSSTFSEATLAGTVITCSDTFTQHQPSNVSLKISFPLFIPNRNRKNVRKFNVLRRKECHERTLFHTIHDEWSVFLSGLYRYEKAVEDKDRSPCGIRLTQTPGSPQYNFPRAGQFNRFIFLHHYTSCHFSTPSPPPPPPITTTSNDNTAACHTSSPTTTTNNNNNTAFPSFSSIPLPCLILYTFTPPLPHSIPHPLHICHIACMHSHTHFLPAKHEHHHHHYCHHHNHHHYHCHHHHHHQLRK
ncbi:hypothetical protein E2C01_046682 [Portunus trituberculatus]|uniref:Uncharacterized protein n=1 Tax=Portunus trituberculatus TaxID=210409 RepID=A0A5B7G8E5_PORTR|nr:hypothetical protein [Portunus trituberculatus]